jgi:hypothetical protein
MKCGILQQMHLLSPLHVSLQHQPFAVLSKQDGLHSKHDEGYICMKFMRNMQ